MTSLAPHLSGFLREHLPKERRASQHTCEAYAQSFQLLLGFAANRLKIKSSLKRDRNHRWSRRCISAYLWPVNRAKFKSRGTMPAVVIRRNRAGLI